MKALIAIDGSRESSNAVDMAAGLDWAPGSRLEILTVAPTDVDLYGGPFVAFEDFGPIDELHRRMKSERDAILDEAVARLGRDDLDVRPRSPEGGPASTIVEEADSDVRRPHHPRGPRSRRARAGIDRLRVVRGGRSCALPGARRSWRSDPQDPRRNRRVGPGDVRGVVRRRVRSVPIGGGPGRPFGGPATRLVARVRGRERVDLFRGVRRGNGRELASTQPPSRRLRVPRWRRPVSRSARASGRVARRRPSWTRRRAGTRTWWSSGRAATGSSRRCSSGARRDPSFSDRRRPC